MVNGWKVIGRNKLNQSFKWQKGYKKVEIWSNYLADRSRKNVYTVVHKDIDSIGHIGDKFYYSFKDAKMVAIRYMRSH